MALPTEGAQISASTVVAASDSAPSHCEIKGAIAPVSENAWPINFSVLIPEEWNKKAVHFGGSGYNGSIPNLYARVAGSPANAQSPLQRGYAVFGSDSGHQSETSPLASFALVPEALENFAHAQLKKTRDSAVFVIQEFKQAKPERTYWFGNSQGGREGVTVAQRYPEDYDGVMARVPVLNFSGLQLWGNKAGQAIAKADVAFTEATVQAVHNAVVAVCDGLDGLQDGVIANTDACKAEFKPQQHLQCGGADLKVDAAACLTPSQVEALEKAHEPLNYGYAVANGVTGYSAWSWGGEMDPGTNAWTWVYNGAKARAVEYGSSFAQYFIAQGSPAFDWATFDITAYQDRIKEVSEVVDSTNPDLSKFYARGGKLLMSENGADYAKNPYATYAYHDAVKEKMGADKAEEFLRLYVTPGADHGVGASQWQAAYLDWLTVLENWVEQGQVPGAKLEHVFVDNAGATTAKRPHCRYPTYPHYVAGDVNDIDSFECRSPNLR